MICNCIERTVALGEHILQRSHHIRNMPVLRRTRAAADGAHAAALPASIAGMHPAGVAEAVVHGSTRSRSEAPGDVPTE